MRNYDTVEAFWDKSILEGCRNYVHTNSIAKFENLFAQFIGVTQANTVPSARWGLEWLFKHIIKTSKKDIMLLAFNCAVVEAAARNAGYDIRLYGFSKNNGYIDFEALADEINRNPPGIIVITHLFGVPYDFFPIVEVCKKNGVIIVEDCAHVLGGKVRNHMAGSIGDYAVFSFNYDKPISLGWGGMLVSRSPYEFKREKYDFSMFETRIDNEYAQLVDFLKGMACRRYQIRNEQKFLWKVLRRLKLFSSANFVVPYNKPVGALQAELGCWSLSKYMKIEKIRNSHARYVAENSQAYQSWYIGENVHPSWLKQKVCLNTRHKSKKIAKMLRAKGFRVGNFNWPRLIRGSINCDLVYCHNAAKYWLDVPIHQNLPSEKLKEIVSILNKAK